MAKDNAEYTVNIFKTEEGWEIWFASKGVFQYPELVDDMDGIVSCLKEYFDG